MIAAVIDSLVVAGILLIAYAAVAIFAFMVDPLSFSLPEAGWLRSLAAAWVVLVVYLTASWVVSERTYGDLLMGLRVVGHGGGRLHLFAAFVRAVACALIPIGLLWCAVNSENRSLQDLVLRTSVIYDWQPRVAPGDR